MIASLLHYARFTRGIPILHISPLNEPDWGNNEGPLVSISQYVRLLKKLSTRLDALSLGDVDFLPADTAFVSSADDYIQALLGDAAIMPKIPLFSIHDYSGNSGPTFDYQGLQLSNAQMAGDGVGGLVWRLR
jgi:hypothetical protein